MNDHRAQLQSIRNTLFGPAPKAKRIPKAIRERVQVRSAPNTLGHVLCNSVTVRIA